MSAPSTILLVEDDEELRTLLADILADHGYRVLVAADAGQAERAFESSGDVDLVVSDLVMPGLGGHALVERLRHRHPGVKALFMSGYRDVDLQRHGILDTSADFLAKPFAFDVLLRRIEEALEQQPRRAS